MFVKMSGALLPSFSLFCPAIAQPLAEMLMQLVPIDVISQGDRRPLLHHCPGIAIRLTPSKPRKRSPGGDDCSRDRPVRSSEVATTSRMKRTSATFDERSWAPSAAPMSMGPKADSADLQPVASAKSPIRPDHSHWLPGAYSQKLGGKFAQRFCDATLKSPTMARRLSVLRGTYHQLAAKGLIAWETAQDIGAVKAPPVQKNSTPSLTERQAISLLEAIPIETLQGIRDLALMSVFYITGCRVSAIVQACVGHLETDGVEHYLHVTEKRNKKRRKILLDAARPVLAYVSRAGIGEDKEGPLFRPMRPDGARLVRRYLDRKTPWRLVKKYCAAAGIDPSRLGSRGIGIHSLRKTAINDAIRNGATMHEVREFAGHADIRTTEVYFVRKEEDAEVAARRIHIRVAGRKGE